MSLESEVEFCFKLFPLLEASINSTVFSPASILNALGMIYFGSAGNTAKQIAEIIGKGKNEKQITEYFSKFVKRHKTTYDKEITQKAAKTEPEAPLSLKETRKRRFRDPEDDPSAKVIVNIVTGFFVAKYTTIVSSFEESIKNNFDAIISLTDFEKTDEAIDEINTFVSDKTDKNIKEIISAKDISGQTSLILINAIHFMGAWKLPFEKESEDGIFFSNSPRKIPMMTNIVSSSEDGWNYQECETWQALGIPYIHCQHWLFIVLPKEKDGLSSLLESFDYSLFKRCTKRKPPTVTTYVRMPIMEITTTIDLIEKLQNMGITDAFSSNCDLSRMLGKSNKIEAAVHKAVIKIDEKGTVASAASVFRAIARSSANIQFNATHPFLYFITSTDKPESLIPKDILFMGTFC